MAWTHANEALLRRIASDSLGHRREWEATADKLWLALAAAREWVAFLDQGYGFVTHLPCFIDGTCNGIQHFSALARDPDLAALVNLTPSDTPQDIYQAEADQALALIGRKAADGDGWARRWVPAARRWSRTAQPGEEDRHDQVLPRLAEEFDGRRRRDVGRDRSA